MNNRMRYRNCRTNGSSSSHTFPTSTATAATTADSSDSTYYTPLDIENDIYASRYQTQRRYIDPWDLENYDYVRKQLDLSPDRSSTPSPAGEPISSNFFYLPNNTDECPACYAGMDEQTFYNAKYESIFDDDTTPYCSYTDFENGGSNGEGENNNSNLSSSSNERNSSCGTSSVSSLMLHTPGFGPATSNRRRLVLPKPAPRIEFPAPPPYDYCISPIKPGPCCAISASSPNKAAIIPENNYCPLPTTDCYECLSAAATSATIHTENSNDNYCPSIYVPLTSIYGGCYSIPGENDDSGVGYIGTGESNSLYSCNSCYINKFGLSKKGLLQIDYSCNWNDLDRYIAKGI